MQRQNGEDPARDGESLQAMNNAELRQGRSYFFNTEAVNSRDTSLRVSSIKYYFYNVRPGFGQSDRAYIEYVRISECPSFFMVILYVGGNEIEITKKQATRLCQDAIEIEIIVSRANSLPACAVINNHLDEALECNRFHPCNACTCVMPGGAA